MEISLLDKFITTSNLNKYILYNLRSDLDLLSYLYCIQQYYLQDAKSIVRSDISWI